MLAPAAESTLILIDLQRRLMPAIGNGDAVLRRCLLSARIAAEMDVPVLGTEQNPAGLGPTVASLAPLLDVVVAKVSFDGSRNPVLSEAIPATRRHLVAAGCEAHVCVLQTVLGLHRQGFEIAVVADAVGSRGAIDRATALTRLAREGIEIVTAEMVAFEWLQDSDHPKFRRILSLIRERDGQSSAPRV